MQLSSRLEAKDNGHGGMEWPSLLMNGLVFRGSELLYFWREGWAPSLLNQGGFLIHISNERRERQGA